MLQIMVVSKEEAKRLADSEKVQIINIWKSFLLV